MRVIPLPSSELFQVHGSKLKPHPVCDLGYTAAQMERAILALLEERQKKMQRKTPER